MDKPTISFRNEAIKKFTGKGVDEFNVDDTLTLAVKCKVTTVESEKYRPYVEEGKKEKPPKLRQRLEMEIIGGGSDKDALDEYFDRKPGD